MAGEDRDRKLINELESVGPGQPGWEETTGKLKKRFGSLAPEDQARIAERYSALAGEDEALGLMAELLGESACSLPAAVVMGKALEGASRPAGLPIDKLEGWLTLCEDDSAACDVAGFHELPEPARQKVLDHLAMWLRTDLLESLRASAPDKKSAKAAAKAIHQAKSRGARAIESVGADASAGFAATKDPERYDEAYLSPPDHTGAVFLYFYRTVFGRHTLFVVLVNDLQGVMRFEAYEVPYHRFQKMLESTAQNPFALLARADEDFLRRTIADAEESGRQRGIEQDQDYLSNRRALGVAEVGEVEHPLWKHLDEKETAAAKTRALTSDTLLSHRVFDTWRLHPLEEGMVLGELAEMRAGVIELTPERQKERERELFEREATRAVEDAGRDAWRDRMLLCAYVLVLMGDVDEAKTAAAAGLALMDGESPLPGIFIELLRRTVEAEMSDDEGGTGPEPGRRGCALSAFASLVGKLSGRGKDRFLLQTRRQAA